MEDEIAKGVKQDGEIEINQSQHLILSSHTLRIEICENNLRQFKFLFFKANYETLFFIMAQTKHVSEPSADFVLKEKCFDTSCEYNQRNRWTTIVRIVTILTIVTRVRGVAKVR